MKAILVGLGGRGRHWLRDCRRHPDVEIVAYVEPAVQNREHVKREFGLSESQIFSDLSDVTRSIEADFVVDATPPSVHEQVAMVAFEAGLHVLGEKPLSDDYSAAQRLVSAGKAYGVKHMVAQNYRFNPLPRMTRKFLEDGVVGDLGQLDVSLYVNWADSPGSHYVTLPYMFLTDMGIHHFDMMRFTLNLEPISVQAITWNLSWGWHLGDACQLILFRFENGLIVTHRGIGCTVGHVPAGHNGEWRYEGSKGTLTWEGFKMFYSHQHKVEKKIRKEIELDEGAHNSQNPVLQEFLSALVENRQPECNSEDNLKSMAMVFGAVLSAKENREVRISEIGSSSNLEGKY